MALFAKDGFGSLILGIRLLSLYDPRSSCLCWLFVGFIYYYPIRWAAFSWFVISNIASR